MPHPNHPLVRIPSFLLATALSLGAWAQTPAGRLTYDVYEASAPGAKKLQSNATCELLPGEKHTQTIQHVRNPRNTGHGDLLLTVDAPPAGTAQFWLIKDGGQTLSFPPYIPGADLIVRKVECLQFATIEDSRFLWDALGGSPSELGKKLFAEARAGAESAARGLLEQAEKSMQGLEKNGLPTARGLQAELERSLADLQGQLQKAAAAVGPLLVSEFPELHEALAATLNWRPKAVAAELNGAVGKVLGNLVGSPLDPPCRVDVSVVGRLQVSLEDLQARLAHWLAQGPIPPEALCTPFNELRGAWDCSAEFERVAEALDRDRRGLEAHLIRLQSLLAQFDPRLLGAAGQDALAAMNRLVEGLTRLQADTQELKRLADKVTAARSDFESSYEKVHGGNSPIDGFLRVFAGQLPLEMLPSLDPEQSRNDLEVHRRNTERLAAGIAARDGQVNRVLKTWSAVSKDASGLAKRLTELRLSGRGVQDLIEALRGGPRFAAPEEAARAAADCLARAQAAVQAALGFLDAIQGRVRDLALPKELLEELSAWRQVLAAFGQQHARVLAASRRLELAQQDLAVSAAAIYFVAGTLAGPRGDLAVVQLRQQVERVEKASKEAILALGALQKEQEQLDGKRAALVISTKKLLASLSARPKAELRELQGLIAAAEGLLKLELEVRGLAASVASCKQQLEVFLGQTSALTQRMVTAMNQRKDEQLIRVAQGIVALREAIDALASYHVTRTKEGVFDTRDIFLAMFSQDSEEQLQQKVDELSKRVPRLTAESQKTLDAWLSVGKAGGWAGASKVDGPVLSAYEQDLRELTRIAGLWNKALGSLPSRLAQRALGGVSDSLRAPQALLEQLKKALGEAEACWSQATGALARLGAPQRVEQAAQACAQLPGNAKQVLEGLQSLWNPLGGWSLEPIGAKIDKGQALLALLHSTAQRAAAKLGEACSSDMGQIASAAECALQRLSEVDALATELRAALALDGAQASPAAAPRPRAPKPARKPAGERR